jgi:hypothetical protein
MDNITPPGTPLVSAHSTPEAKTPAAQTKQASQYDFNCASFGTSELFIGICGLIGAGKVIEPPPSFMR